MSGGTVEQGGADEVSQGWKVAGRSRTRRSGVYVL